MKIKRIISVILLFVFMTGCAGPLPLQKTMYTIPAFDNDMPYYTVINFSIPYEEDIAGGVGGRMAWPAYSFGGAYKELGLIAVNLRDFTGDPAWIILAPGPIDAWEGFSIGITDRCSERIYNEKGGWQKLEKSITGKLQLEKHSAFMSKIEEGRNAKEIKRGSKEFEALAKVFQVVIIQEVEPMKRYIYSKYGTNLNEKQLEHIAEIDSRLRAFKRWFGSGWKAVLAYPVISPAETGAYMVIAKIMDLPRFWNDREEVIGCLGYKPDAESVAQMIQRGIELHIDSAPKDNNQNLLPASMQRKLLNDTGKYFTTYEEYNDWVVEQNKKQKK